MKILLIVFVLFNINLFASLLREGNTTLATSLLSVVATSNPSISLATTDRDNDKIPDSMIIIDTASPIGYIEFQDLSMLPDAIATAIGAPLGVLFDIKKLYKENGDKFVIVGSYKDATSPTGTFGFCANFDFNATTNVYNLVSQKSYKDYNITTVNDVVLTNTDSYIVVGSIYTHNGLGSYRENNATVVLNQDKQMAWTAELNKTNLAIVRHHYNDFNIDESFETISVSLNRNETEVISLAIKENNGSKMLFAYDTNMTIYKSSNNTLKRVGHYLPYTKRINYLSVGTVIDLSMNNFLGDYAEQAKNATVQYFPANASAPLPPILNIPSTALGITYAFPYTLNASANVTMSYSGYVAGSSNEWDYMDLNCSDTLGVSRNVSDIYVIPFPVSKIPTTPPSCQPPNFNFYVSDKNFSQINLQWEWIYPKKRPVKWNKIVKTKVEPTKKSKIVVNKNYLGKDFNKSTATIYHHSNPRRNFHLIEINTETGLLETDRTLPKKDKNISFYQNGALATDQDGNLVLMGTGVKDDDPTSPNQNSDCLIIKVDKYGHELWEQYIGNYWNEICSDIAIIKTNRNPTYHEYIAVGATRSTSANNSTQGWAVTFRDSGILMDIDYKWNMIGNPTNRNITNNGFLDNENNIGISALGLHKYYMMFKDNQWLLNKTPIEPLDGFFLVSYKNKQQIFLEGTLIKQKFDEIKRGETGWILVTTGEKLVNPKVKNNLYAIYIYRNGQYQKNPITIYPGEGFWVKKYK